METQRLHIDGLDIAVTRSAGRGPPVVLEHGNSASARRVRGLEPGRPCRAGGEREQVVRLDYLRCLAMPALWRGAVQVIDAAGHAPQWEQPAAFAAPVTDFVAHTGAAPMTRP